VRFPNPEEPGALDLAVELAAGVEAGLILANDPDTDRLAVSLPRPDGTWANLTGNQIGVVLADYLLTAWAQGPLQPLVVNSIVSTPMAAAVAAAHGARHEVTLTGFKWIWNAALDIEEAHEGVRFVFGFEEALGYSVGPMVRDKDGIGAAVVFADLAATLRARGLTVGEHLTDLYRRHGLWVSRQLSIVRPGTGGLEEIDRAVRSLGDDPPAELAGRAVTGFTDYRTGAAARPRWLGPTDLIALDLGSDTRVLARPSGTEPKLKIYVDLREPLEPDDDAATVAASATAAADALAADLAFRMGFAG
jgi:phosphomannomutase